MNQQPQRKNSYDEKVADFLRSKTLRYYALILLLIFCAFGLMFACIAVLGGVTIVSDLNRLISQ